MKAARTRRPRDTSLQNGRGCFGNREDDSTLSKWWTSTVQTRTRCLPCNRAVEERANYRIFHNILPITFGNSVQIWHYKKAQKVTRNPCLILNRKEKREKQDSLTLPGYEVRTRWAIHIISSVCIEAASRSCIFCRFICQEEQSSSY